MPLDLCHPTAPHEKLKLPEWYVSSLMMDRALDAICRRVKKFDCKHDVPYLAGYSLDGKTIYIDRHMPASFKFERGPPRPSYPQGLLSRVGGNARISATAKDRVGAGDE